MKTVAAWLLLCAALGAQTPQECWKNRYYGRNAEAEKCFERLSYSSDPHVKAEGLWGMGYFEDANTAFRAAAAIKKTPQVTTRWGRMFQERWNKGEAARLFQEALDADENYAPALLGMAMVLSEGFDAKAVEFAEKALKADPKLLEAQELLAKLAIEDVNFDKARQEAGKALQIAPDAIDAMAILGALDVLSDNPSTPWFAKMDAVNPVHAEGYAYVAQTLILNRRYLEAIEFFKKSLDKDPRYWKAHSELGISYMRLGMEAPARKHLELAYGNNFRDPATVNTLRLMDSYKNYETFKAPGLEVRLQKKEADLLKLYFVPELQKAIATYEKKYRFKLKEPVKLEVYPEHEDFAVRTMGMPGLGALGVAFGYVVAMDSPSGRKPGDFHWASTLWHELSHVFVLSATQHRVPRWFTEGLSVHEETAIYPDWGDRLAPPVLQAVKDKKLLPIAQLDRGFIRPAYPNQVIVSYFQGGKVIDFIVEKWGFDKVLEMMKAFSQTVATSAVVEKHLAMKPEEFDKQFLAWLDAQLKTPLEKFGEWSKRRLAMVNNVKQKKWDDVIKEGREIRDWYPDYVEGFSVYEMLADAYEAKGDEKAAVAELEQYARQGGRFPANLKELAEKLAKAGRHKDAVATLEKLNWIYPVADADYHQKQGEWNMTLERLEPAIREFQASIASKPSDPAQAHFQLAQAYRKASQTDKAMEHVVSALETAPGFKPAQKLLLELTSPPAANTNQKKD
ncbi:MAG: tetratricopeptide repeat protein [Bryobacterales bacterium]|nr:tetratricopeptide repeat protein [Bryobacterales bacterium]